MASQCSKFVLLLLMGSTLLIVYLIFPESLPSFSKIIAQYTIDGDGNLENKVKMKHARDFKRDNKTPLILLYNTWRRFSIWGGLDSTGKDSLKHLTSCPHRCHYSFNRKLYEETADLVIVSSFYFRNINDSLSPERIKAQQDNSGQTWLSVSNEAPNRLQQVASSFLDGVFNWISTYRRDADIYWPYGRFVKQKHSTKSKVSVPTRRKKLASWLVSNCKANSMRRLLVSNLQRFIPIDVYGKCQKLKCPPKQDCRAFLGRTYKFYMAFENSLCLDYLTEKVFRAYKYNLVPVIYAWLNDSTLLPPGSYINALDFNTPKDLANYLRHLDTHEKEYQKYFEWKRNYRLKDTYNSEMLCGACAKLHRHLALNEVHVKRYSSLLGWLNSLQANHTSSGLMFKFGQNTLSTGGKLCVNASESPEVLAWLTK